MKIREILRDWTARLAVPFPAELVLIVVILALLGASALGPLRNMQAAATVARVHTDLAWLRQGVYAYQADQNIYPRMAWGSSFIQGYHPWDQGYMGDVYQDIGVYSALTRAMTTPIAYLPKYDLLDPWHPRDDGSGAPLYVYQAMWCHDVLRSLGASSGAGIFGSSNSIVGNRVARADFGEFFLLSIGPRGNPTLYWPYPGHTLPAPLEGAYTQYDPTNGTTSAGTIYVSDKHAEPVQRPY